MKHLIIVLIMIINSIDCHSQLLDKSLFRIYRSEFILGTVTHLRLEKDNSYSMTITEIDCSLCDRKKLSESIESEGTWIQNGDTISLSALNGKTTKLKIINDSLLRPSFPIGYEQKSENDSILKILDLNLEQIARIQAFHLIYDTYTNGVARFIIDKYRGRRAGYEMELKSDGTMEKFRYFWDNKQRKKIR